MRKSKILSVGIILALLALTVSLSSCATSSGTTTDHQQLIQHSEFQSIC